MRLCYLGGEERRRYLQDAASAGVAVEIIRDFTPSVGRPETIESLYEEALLAPWTVEMAVEAERRGYDAVITGCVGDPGVEAARELVRIPVIGPAQASFHTAAMLGTTFGVLSPVESTVRPTRALIHHYGLAGRCVAVRAVNCPVMALREGRPETLEAVLAVARRVLDDGADVLVLACASLSHTFGDRLAAMLPVPVVNALRVSVRAAELLVGAGLTHSKVAYPFPPKTAADALRR
ncbi:MAG: AroM family protein [Armatimonadota bacterium]|nr:AroM family protein [Armatimonadota bacterium]MDR7454836.1 AroM family protein [Armatimonadota bacterium]MDR7457784.1 AroM family protein [Armatimonadota bacterium]MDR7497072.1 AroM family protein [Armatimonadota bacterium]MDR7512149.1 AroM family protein [Armatimonadota bacterium]